DTIAGADPPCAVAGLQRHSVVGPAKSGDASRPEPVKAVTIECAVARVQSGLVVCEQAQRGAFEHAGPCISEHRALEAQIAGPILEDVVDGFDTVLLAIRDEAAARDSHRSGRRRA